MGIPTNSFTISGPQQQEVGEFHADQESGREAAFEVVKVSDGLSPNSKFKGTDQKRVRVGIWTK